MSYIKDQFIGTGLEHIDAETRAQVLSAEELEALDIVFNQYVQESNEDIRKFVADRDEKFKLLVDRMLGHRDGLLMFGAEINMEAGIYDEQSEQLKDKLLEHCRIHGIDLKDDSDDPYMKQKKAETHAQVLSAEKMEALDIVFNQCAQESDEDIRKLVADRDEKFKLLVDRMLDHRDTHISLGGEVTLERGIYTEKLRQKTEKKLGASLTRGLDLYS